MRLSSDSQRTTSAWYFPTFASASFWSALAMFDLGLGQLHQLLGLLDHAVVQLDLGQLLLVLFVQFGNEDLAEHLALFHLSPMSTSNFLMKPETLEKIEVCS